jgi:amino acid adenylation domain-containing protein
MSTAAELLVTLRQKDVKLWLDGDKLRYRAAKDTLSPELLAQLKTQKAEIIDFLKSIGAGSNSPIPPLVPGDRTGSLPLSFGQQRLWFLHQFEPNSSANNVPVVVRLKGTLNVLALEQSLNYVVSRHEVLRTTFPSIDGQPIQAIATDFSLTLPLVDLQHFPAERREAEALRLATAEAHQPFDLAQGPNLRVLLLRLDPIEHLLIWNMNSIICDGASSDLFYQETIACYRAFSTGRTPALPPLSIQYADFAQWQRNWLQGEVLNTQVDYWKQKLGGNLPTIQLPFDRPRPVGVPTYKGDRAARMLPKGLENSLNKLSQSWGGTLFMTLLTAFNVLLYRYSGQEDLLVSFASTGRGQAELEQSIGFFSNTLLLRTKLEGNPTFRELADRVRLDCVEAYSHQDVPFEKLVEELPSEQRLDRSPLFQVKFALNPPWSNGRGMAAVELPDLTITSLFGYIYHGQTKYDLILVMREQDEGLGMVFDYNADMFEASTIDRMLGHFQTLLEGIVANPDRSISELPLITLPEQQQLLAWNQTQADYPARCLHQLFEAQVERTPDAVAVVYVDKQLTYRELNHRANQLAHYLQSLGVKADVLVGLCVQRSLELVVGLLGILKAGGAYVPLDPDYPADRLSFMLEDTQVPVLLTTTDLVDRLPDNLAQLVILDRDWQTIDIENSENPQPQVTPDNLGYVIYTSGSTGKPKGVAMTQLALSNLILWQLSNTTISQGGRTLQFSPISFDVSFQEIFTTWSSGGTLILIEEELRKDTLALLNLLDRAGIERLFLPFVALQQLAEMSVSTNSFPTQLKEVITAGEQLQIIPAITEFFTHLADCRLFNHYGPSESHVVTSLILPDAVKDWATLPPIGRPIANTQIQILDAYLNPVPIGISGEIYIGGVCLARGYLNRPDLTAEKFRLDPFNNCQTSRLYQTGDLARYLPTGDIEYLGRVDNQVKIRGFRIELGEIEVVLIKCPAISQAAVIADGKMSGNKRLVAYIVPDREQPITVQEIRSFLGDRLPDYMIPSAFIVLDKLPTTPSGKVDRRALPSPEEIRPELEDTFLAPRNELEIQLTKIWRKVLGIPAIGIRDNFFELGGHSLIAVRLFAEIEQTWGKNLPLATLFQAQTIEKMADILLEQAWVAPWSSLVPIQPNGSKTPLFCIHPIGGNVLEYYPLADYLGNEQPIYGLQSLGLDGKQPPLNCVKEMASHYIKELVAVQPHGPYAILGYSFGGLVAFEIAQQLLAAGQEIALLAILDLKSPNLPKARPSFAKSIGIHFKNLGQLPERGKIKYIRDRIDYRLTNKFDYKEFLIKSLAGVAPPSAELLDIIDANFQAIRSYSIRPYAGNATLFRCQVQTLDYALSADLGWSELIAGNLEIFNIDSIHYGMLREPSIKVVAEKLKLCLENISSN